MARFHGYKSAEGVCAGKAQDGAKALMSWHLGAYQAKGAENHGIYNCREIRGSSRPSVHSEGRAADLGVPDTGEKWAQSLANFLVNYSKELGIQCVIYNRRIWSGAHPDSGWRQYGGVNPHTRHLHVELSWGAARSLTVEKIKRVVSSSKAPAGTPFVLRRCLEKGVRGEDVKKLQRYLGFKGSAVDGVFGDQTTAAVKRKQRSFGLVNGAVDGVVGPVFAKKAGWRWAGR
jgi:hypothetical protein